MATRDFLRQWGPLLQVVLGVVISATSAADMLGRPARAVTLLGLGAGMFGAGLGLGAILARRRLRNPRKS